MGLLSIFRRQTDAALPVGTSNDPSVDVQRARTRARQRLIGAVVLVVVGVIGFPLVFETQPRPISVDIPIEIPRKDAAAPLVMPPARKPTLQPPEPVVATPSGNASAPVAANGVHEEVITEPREEVRPVPAVPNKPASAPAPAPKPVAVPKPTAEAKPTVTAVERARVQALLEDKKPASAAAAAAGARFVVQIGAFADNAAAHEVRVKAEHAGLKTYTQVVETTAGRRIRVRLGPFTSRDEADKQLAKARSAGLTAVVLTL